jgi:hypothetical protein
MQRILTVLIGCLIGVTGLVHAQTKHTLSGKLTDDAGEPLPAATVMLLQEKDSILQSFALTEADGQFRFADVPPGNYVLKAMLLKHTTLTQRLQVGGEKAEIDLGGFKLTPESAKLEDVEITDERIPVRIKGDTIEYDAKAFTVQPGDAVEELFKKLPGIEVDRDGNIKAQGENVTKILVDGKEFFGDDPKVASKNLPADAVDKVQVFDKMSDVSEFTGIDDGNRTRTINLALKEDHKTGYFGNVMAGYGTKERFESKANLNRFGDKSQLSFLGQANNTNQQGFSMQDYMGFMGGIGNMMRSNDPTQSMSPSDLGLNLSSNPNSGFFTTAAGGLNGNWTPNAKTQLTASYFYNYLRKDIRRSLEKETILDEGSFLTLQNGDQRDKNQNHRASLYWKQELDTLTRLSLRVNYKMNTTASLANDTVQSIQFTGSENRSEQHYLTNSLLDDINPSLSLMHRFRKRGRSATLSGNFRYNPQEKDVDLTSANQFAPADTSLLFLDTLRQNQIQDQSLFSFNGRASYTEPFGLHHAVEAYVQYQQADNFLDKRFYDLDADGSSPILNTFLSTSYETTYRYERGGLNWRYYNKSLNLTTGLAVQNSELIGEVFSTGAQIHKRFFNLLPSVSLRMNKSKSQEVRANYNTRVVEPSLAQLQPVPDNSNPLNITVGNPDLRAEYVQSLRLNYSFFDQFSFTSFFANVNANYTSNKISQRTTIDTLLRQVTMPVNVDNDLQVNGNLHFGTPLRKLKIKVNLNGNSSYGRSLVYINDALNVVNRYTNGGDIRIENKTKDHFDANIGARTSYTITNYPDASDLNQSYVNSGLFGELMVFLPKKFTVMTGIDYSIYSGLGNNQGVPLWRAYVSKKIFKNGRGELRISAYDLLNKNIGISRTAQLNYTQQETVNTLSRYFLGSFSYAIVSVGKKH